MFKKILIANRGEIAVRVIRTAKKMGIKTVAVYSDADKNSMHVKLADEAVYIGASPASESYLVQDKIIEACKQTDAEAIHPGYGFLSENASFSERCREEGIEFIGPSPEAIKTMGDKITARKTMMQAGVPVVPGIENFTGGDDELLRLAEEIGFPVMVKASAGGGGKGMRLVYSADELIDAVKMARGEAKASFGDDTVYIEKFVSSPHHIEFQILADKFGNAVHINERECSVQRRHQKVIEETPSPLMTPALREEMGKAAVQAAKTVNYTGAGTIEFLVDDDLNFYFLEMNTRLQVEHPITEMTSGIDLVEQQILIAAGEEMKLRQENIKQEGHAIECRIYAEDTDNNFMPSPGKIHYISEPKGENVRIDGYVYSGFEIPIYYDPMISKLIVWAEDRQKAIEKMKKTLEDYKILGVKTNIAYLYKILEHQAFTEGKYDTRFVGMYKEDLEKVCFKKDEFLDYIAASVYIDYFQRAKNNTFKLNFTPDMQTVSWKEMDLNIDDTSLSIKLLGVTGLNHQFKINDEVKGIRIQHPEDNIFLADYNKVKVTLVPTNYNALNYCGNVGLVNFMVDVIPPQKRYFDIRNVKAQADASNVIMTPMPGKIVKILVSVGDLVNEGDNIIIVEAMKMQSEYKSPGSKRVKEVLVSEGDAIDGNQPLVILEDIEN